MAKIERVNEQIAKTKAKIAGFQEQLRELEKQKAELEDEEILKMVHGFNLKKNDLEAFFQSLEKEEENKKESESKKECEIEKMGELMSEE